MDEHIYHEPVSHLINLGDPLALGELGTHDWQSGPNWYDYPEKYGFTAGHIPELIHMAVDDALHNAETESTEVYAPVHAWRALAQMKAGEAIRPLLGLFHRADDDNDDWIIEDMPEVMGMIGLAAISPVAEYLADPNKPLWARITAAASLEKICATHPQARQACIDGLVAALKNFTSNDPILNGELVGSLAELDAVEAAPLVEQAFNADRVNEGISGDWEDFQVDVGLLEERLTDPDYDLDFNPFFPSDLGEPRRSSKKEDKQVKKKRKQAKESRKKNRKKKK